MPSEQSRGAVCEVGGANASIFACLRPPWPPHAPQHCLLASPHTNHQPTHSLHLSLDLFPLVHTTSRTFWFTSHWLTTLTHVFSIAVTRSCVFRPPTYPEHHDVPLIRPHPLPVLPHHHTTFVTPPVLSYTHAPLPLSSHSFTHARTHIHSCADLAGESTHQSSKAVRGYPIVCE